MPIYFLNPIFVGDPICSSLIISKMLSNLNLQENNSIEAKTEIPKIGFRKNSSIEKAKENEGSSHFGNSLKIAFCQPTLCLLICAATFRHAGKNKNNLIGLLEI